MIEFYQRSQLNGVISDGIGMCALNFSFEPEEVITCKLQLELSMTVFRIEPHLFDVTPEFFSTNGTSTRLCFDCHLNLGTPADGCAGHF